MKLFTKKRTESPPMSPLDLPSEGGGIELSIPPIQPVLSNLETLCGHPVTTFSFHGLPPVAPTLAEELERIERAQLSQSLAFAGSAELEREIEALEEQVEEQSDEARIQLSGVGWDRRREAAVALSRLRTRDE